MRTELARAESERGELVLRRRADGALELRVNGVFVMDDVAPSSEQALAEAGLGSVPQPRRVLVAGLGLGFTLRAVLDHPLVQQVTVVELEPAVLGWARQGLLPAATAAVADPRVTVRVGDVAAAVSAAAASSVDVVLLDVDNGPDHLVHDDNRLLYQVPFLRRCDRALAPAGVLAVWSMAESATLMAAMRAMFDPVWTRTCPVRLADRHDCYVLHLGRASTRPHVASH